MTHDRARIKARAKTILRQADPRPWSVTLIHWFFSADLCALCLLFFLAAGLFSGHRPSPVLLLACVLLAVAVLLFLLVFQAGHVSYTLRLSRTGKGGPMDLISGFFRGGEILTLRALVALACLLWPLGGELAVRLLLLLSGAKETAALILGVLLRLALGALVLNRQLEYALSLRVLLSHPELSAADAISRSRRMMDGRKLDFFLLMLSFLGWILLAVGVVALTVLPGALIHVAAEALPALAALPQWSLIPFAVAGALAAFPLLLWLTCYIELSWAGFYDAASAPPFPGASPPASANMQGGKRLK